MTTAAEKIRWYVHRVRAMSPAEVGHRFAEKYRQATQGRYVHRLASVPWENGANDLPRVPDPALAPPALRAQLALDAQRLEQGEWRLFGWQEVRVGTPPEWHRDPVCGVTIDAKTPSHRLNHRDLPGGADVRRIWEINRWSEITRLAMHGWLNGDANALQLTQRWLADWCDQNPPGCGINWTSPLEAALRLLNFCWIDALVRAGAPMAAEVQDRLAARIVPIHAGWIWRHRSTGSSANNHLLGELAALVVAAARWPGLEQTACSADTAWQALSAEVLRQFAADGGSREQALHYHLFAWDLAWQAARAMNCTSGPVHDRLTAAADFFAQMAPTGEAWDFGDSDDAQVAPFLVDRTEIGREWKAWLQGESGSLQFWLGEAPGLHPGADDEWRVYPETGMAVTRGNGWQVRLDGSPLGFGTLAAHGHCDALHASIWDGADALMIDPGTGGYFGAAGLRTRLAAWDAHNGPQPARGFRTPERIGVFLQTRHHATPSLAVHGSEASSGLRHEGHGFHRRVVVRAGGIEITDEEEEGRPMQVLWQLAPGCVVRPASEGHESCWHLERNGRRWRIIIEGNDAEATLLQNEVSPAYGRVESAMALSVTATGRARMVIERTS